jgi:hypothetical protein
MAKKRGKRGQGEKRAEGGGKGRAWIVVGFVVGLWMPLLLGIAVSPPPDAEALFGMVTHAVSKPPSEWGCNGDEYCDQWLECAKMTEVVRVADTEEGVRDASTASAAAVVRYSIQMSISSAMLCNQVFVGVCGVWGTHDERLRQTFAENQPGAMAADTWLCAGLRRVVLAGRSMRARLSDSGVSAEERTAAERLLQARARAGYNEQVQRLRERAEQAGGELIDTSTGKPVPKTFEVEAPADLPPKWQKTEDVDPLMQ